MNTPVTEVGLGQPWWRLEWGEIWNCRYLWRLLVRKELLASYKQSVLGPVWFVIQPVVTALLFALVFGRLAGLTPIGAPRFLFFLAATVPWTYFQSVSQGVAGSLAANSHILGKVYFPRLLAPLAMSGVMTIHFVINYVVFMCVYAGYCYRSGYQVLFPAWGGAIVLVLAIVVLLLGLGTGLWCAAIGVRYRDVRISLPVILQTWMFATPIIYPASIVPPAWQPVFFLNPMASVVELHRHLFFGTPLPPFPLLALGVATTAVILISGLFLFNRVQRTFIDLI